MYLLCTKRNILTKAIFNSCLSFRSDKYAAMGASVATPHTLHGEWDIVLMLNPSELHEVHTLRYCLTRAIHSLIILDTFASKPDEKVISFNLFSQ